MSRSPMAATPLPSTPAATPDGPMSIDTWSTCAPVPSWVARALSCACQAAAMRIRNEIRNGRAYVILASPRQARVEGEATVCTAGAGPHPARLYPPPNSIIVLIYSLSMEPRVIRPAEDQYECRQGQAPRLHSFTVVPLNGGYYGGHGQGAA